jgi:FKBP-type peptidyl-prolyl cis-trans isomerase FkpA
MFLRTIVTKSNSLLFVILLILIGACSDTRFRGYSPTNSGLYYKIVKLGDGKNKPQMGDYLKIAIVYKTLNDSVFLDTYTYNESGKVILPYDCIPSFKGSFEEILNTMTEGDLYSFMVNKDSLFIKFFKASSPSFLKDEQYVKMDVYLDKILNHSQYVNEIKTHYLLAKNKQVAEQDKLKLYIDTCTLDYFKLDTHMYYLPVKQGVGSTARYGDEITIHYKGCFLNGFEFESSYKYNQPLQFILGQEGQIIKGIEKGISLMNEGAKTKFIIPSHLAFGSDGSSTGIVPPYTTVIYEVELIHAIPQQTVKKE